MNKNISDLPDRDLRTIVVVRPDLDRISQTDSYKRKYGSMNPPGIKKADFFKNGIGLFPNFPYSFSEILQNIIEFRNMVHVGDLICINTSIPDKFYPCKGSLSLVDIENDPLPEGSIFKSGNVKLKLACTDCKMEVATILSFESLKEPLFFLALKQMYPETQTCRYIDCAWVTGSDKERISPINRLGFISVFRDSFAGQIRHYRRGFVDLGFMLMSGMKTRNGFHKFDAWARFLFNEWQERLKTQFREIPEKCMGPKS